MCATTPCSWPSRHTNRSVETHSDVIAPSNAMQGVGQSVAWSQYLKYSGGKLLSQLCLEEPNPTRSGHLAVPPLLEDGEDGGGKIEDAKDEDKKRTTGRAEQGRHRKETES